MLTAASHHRGKPARTSEVSESRVTGVRVAVNPEGGIALLEFRAAGDGNVTGDDSASFTFYSFNSAGYNDPLKRDPLLNAGIRWSLRPETMAEFDGDENPEDIEISASDATFSKDLEPEYLALSSDGRTVYVGLQENCAIAIFDLVDKEFKDIKALQPK
jgi:hypothetical protein